MSTERPHCVLVGIGPGTGAACARHFSQAGYTVSIISRSNERLAKFAADIPHTVPYRADLADSDNYRATLERIVNEQGVPRVVIHNATQATFGRYEDIAIEKFERNFRVNTAGLLITAQVFGPKMVAAGEQEVCGDDCVFLFPVQLDSIGADAAEPVSFPGFSLPVLIQVPVPTFIR